MGSSSQDKKLYYRSNFDETAWSYAFQVRTVHQGRKFVLPGTVLDMMEVYDDLDKFIEETRFTTFVVLGTTHTTLRELLLVGLRRTVLAGSRRLFREFTESVPLGSLKF